MKRLSLKQKQEIATRARFWAAHASHWMIALMFLVITFSFLYTFWGNDQAFAAVTLGGQ